MAIKIKTEKEISLIRSSCILAAEILVRSGELVKPGITTEEINTFVHNFTIKSGAIPSPLNYHGFPKSVCTSVNNQVCHGVPGPYVLKEGDIINIDVTCTLKGYHGDTSKTFLVGQVSPEVKKLVEVTQQSLEVGILAAFAGNFFGDIGSAIQDYVDPFGYSIVRDYCGHGTGRVFHEEPFIPHFRQHTNGARITEGMVFTIEPMINEGTWEVVKSADNQTIVTKDGKLSAQFEHTLAMTENGPEVLTRLGYV